MARPKSEPTVCIEVRLRKAVHDELTARAEREYVSKATLAASLLSRMLMSEKRED